MITAAPFMPMAVNTRAVSISGSTASGSLNIVEGGSSVGGRTVRVFNNCSGICFIKFGDSTVTAATTDMPIAPGAVEVFTIGDATYVAGITSGATGTLYATAGNGA